MIVYGFPKKIVELNDLLETPQFYNKQFADVYQDLNINVPVRIINIKVETQFNKCVYSQDPIILNHKDGENDQPSAKRPRVDLSESGTTVMLLKSGSVKCNQPISELIKVR